VIQHSAYALVIEQRDQMVFLIALIVLSALALLWSIKDSGLAFSIMRVLMIGGFYASMAAMWLVLNSAAH
jgi:hypothetical protein